MRPISIAACGLLVCVLLSAIQTECCVAQYLPYGGGWYGSAWGAVPSLAAAQRQTTIYNNYQANMRQSLQMNAIQHQNQNQFLMQRAQSMTPATTTRQSAENWMLNRQPQRVAW
ncbi:MAG: hypothetical protein GX621_17955 [Pirellulaceae bacterium]|nr:hypothetical protein [Pirellulaceae bacterium]